MDQYFDTLSIRLSEAYVISLCCMFTVTVNESFLQGTSHHVYIFLISVVQCIYHLREAHEIFVTGVEFAPTTVSQAVVGPNVDFTLFSISADCQIKAHQLESRRMFPFLYTMPL